MMSGLILTIVKDIFKNLQKYMVIWLCFMEDLFDSMADYGGAVPLSLRCILCVDEEEEEEEEEEETQHTWGTITQHCSPSTDLN